MLQRRSVGETVAETVAETDEMVNMMLQRRSVGETVTILPPLIRTLKGKLIRTNQIIKWSPQMDTLRRPQKDLITLAGVGETVLY